MNKLIALASVALIASPAKATGGFHCRTADPRAIEVSIGFGHVPGSPLILARLLDSGRTVPVRWAQWWLDASEMRLLLIHPNAHREELRLKAKRNGHVFDGSVWRNGHRRWVRCRED
ncbi:MAG TPA: hypothetical protein VF079_07765 [Sphingomicrobium sp.]